MWSFEVITNPNMFFQVKSLMILLRKLYVYCIYLYFASINIKMPYKSKEDKRIYDRQYRKEYYSRPEVQERIKQKKIEQMGYEEYDRRYLLGARLEAQLQRFDELRRIELNK